MLQSIPPGLSSGRAKAILAVTYARYQECSSRHGRDATWGLRDQPLRAVNNNYTTNNKLDVACPTFPMCVRREYMNPRQVEWSPAFLMQDISFWVVPSREYAFLSKRSSCVCLATTPLRLCAFIFKLVTLPDCCPPCCIPNQLFLSYPHEVFHQL